MCYECSFCKISSSSTVSLLVIVCFQAINGLLQQRSKALDLDLIRANQLPDDYDTDLESEWSNPSKSLCFQLIILIEFKFVCKDSSRMEMIFHGKQFKLVEINTIKNNKSNILQKLNSICLFFDCFQADVIAKQVSKTLASITAALNIHLNVGQNLTMNTTSVFVSLETVSFQSLANKLISQVANAQIRLPAQINSNQTSNSSVSLRVRSNFQ